MKAGGSRRLLPPLVPVYAAVVGVKRWLFDRGLLKAKRLPHPVISVGSLSVGGAGKTPVVMLLAELLERHSFEVRVLSRGYGRSGTAIERVDPNGDAARFGDEPLLMARRLHHGGVYVGADRFQAGLLAGSSDTAETKAVYLLDDGFQHRKLARDIDVALLTRQDVEDRLLPAGNLREPLQALRRADILIMREEEVGVEELVRAAVAGTQQAVWVIKRRFQFPDNAALPTRPVVFCALARPEGFVKMLRDAGILPLAVLEFRDHHPYSGFDIDRLIDLARQHKADGFLTTEKDAVKLNAAMRKRLETVAPVMVPQLRVDLLDEQRAMAELMALLGGRHRGAA